MKKLFPFISAIIIGIFLSKSMFNQYNYDNSLETVFNNGTNVYFLQQGVYSNLESMKSSLTGIGHYIYSFIDDKYYVYIGITKNENNLTKLKDYYNNLGYSIYVKELSINNSEFLTLLGQYDTLLEKSTEKSVIEAIIVQTLTKYEEYNK